MVWRFAESTKGAPEESSRSWKSADTEENERRYKLKWGLHDEIDLGFSAASLGLLERQDMRAHVAKHYVLRVYEKQLKHAVMRSDNGGPAAARAKSTANVLGSPARTTRFGERMGGGWKHTLEVKSTAKRSWSRKRAAGLRWYQRGVAKKGRCGAEPQKSMLLP